MVDKVVGVETGRDVDRRKRIVIRERRAVNRENGSDDGKVGTTGTTGEEDLSS